MAVHLEVVGGRMALLDGICWMDAHESDGVMGPEKGADSHFYGGRMVGI